MTFSWVNASLPVLSPHFCQSLGVGGGAVTTGGAADAVGRVDPLTGGIDCDVVCIGPVESVACGVSDGSSGAARAANATTNAAAKASCFGGIFRVKACHTRITVGDILSLALVAESGAVSVFRYLSQVGFT